ncbi:MAG: hypothetical protein ACE5KI_02715 [Dehalococcoidia bacterium]
MPNCPTRGCRTNRRVLEIYRTLDSHGALVPVYGCQRCGKVFIQKTPDA